MTRDNMKRMLLKVKDHYQKQNIQIKVHEYKFTFGDYDMVISYCAN
jgi:uncharacterized protein with GYD domain